jgi:hypothetical protein
LYALLWGIVSADVMLTIDLHAIPQIRDRLPDSLNRVQARNGTEWKILVDIPVGAIGNQ